MAARVIRSLICEHIWFQNLIQGYLFMIHFEWVLGAAFVDKHSGMVVATEDDLLGGKFDGAPDLHARCSKEWPPWM